MSLKHCWRQVIAVVLTDTTKLTKLTLPARACEVTVLATGSRVTGSTQERSATHKDTSTNHEPSRQSLGTAITSRTVLGISLQTVSC